MKKQSSFTNVERRKRGATIRSMHAFLLAAAGIASLSVAVTLPLRAQQVERKSSAGTTARYLGTLEEISAAQNPQLNHPLAIIAKPPTPAIISFNAAEVGVSATVAQQLTASFSVSGYSGSFTPTATLHYGHDYAIGAVTCSGGGASETCNATVTFQPSLPGARKDAIFLMDGTTRLATVLLGGIGQAPFSLLQPGSFSTSVPTNDYIYQSVADENGVVYILPSGNSPYIESVTKAGVANQIALTSPPYFWTISVDGAGVLYLFNETSKVTTYDTVQGVQGTYQIPEDPPVTPDGTTDWYPGAVGVDGSIYVVNQIRNNGVAYALRPNGTTAYADLFDPGVLQPFTAAVDSAGDFFVGGYEINEITPAGVQTQVNTVGASEGLAVDAADTLYATRYSPTDGVAELPASNYSTPIASFGRSSPLGMSLGSDGTLYISNYVNLDIFDRSTTETVDFGEVNAGSSQTNSTASVYNGGNEPLTILAFTLSELSDAGFSVDFSGANECTFNIVLAPGTLCQVSVVFAPTHPGKFSGAISISSNSLNGNGTNSPQTIQLAGTADGSYDVLSPSPLDFAAQAPGTNNTLAVTMTNQGNFYASTIYSVATDNPVFTIAQGTCSGVAVQVGASCQLQVTFSPIAAQAYTGTATIVTYVSGSGQPFQKITLPLSGSGVGPLAATPVILPGTGTYKSSQQVTITDDTSNSTIYYTTDGSIPSTNSTKYIGAIAVSANETVNAIATATGFSQSATASATYTFQEPVATTTPTGLAFGNQAQSVPSVAKTVTLRNTGIGTLTLTGFPISGSGDFSQTNNCAGSLTAGSNCTVSIVYTPTSLGDKTATLTVNSDSIQAAPTVSLTGTGIAAPVATLTPASLNFAPQQQGSASAVMILTLSNPSSTTALNLDSTSISGSGSASFSQANNCGAAIAAGGDCSISVTFTPVTVGSLSAGLAVVTRYPAFGPVTVSSTLSGTGTTPPPPTFTPSTLAFGNQIVTTTSARLTTTLTNQGTDTLVIDGALPTILGAGADSISAASNCPAILAPAATCTVSATFTPSSVTAYSLSLQMTAHYAGAPSIKFTPTVALTGTGVNPPAPTFTPSTLAFGNQIVTTTSARLTATLTNTGADTLVIDGALPTVVGAGADSVSAASNCPTTLSPAATCTVSATFTPSSVTAYSLSLQMTAHYAGAPSLKFTPTVALTGTGVNPPPPTITPASLSFGNQPIGSTSPPQTVTLTNPPGSDQTITLGNFIFASDNPSFTQTSNCPRTLEPGSSCPIGITFTPNSIGVISDSLELSYMAGKGGSSVYLSTTGAGINPPRPTLSPTSLTFGPRGVETTSASQTVTVTNPTGADQPITVQPFTFAQGTHSFTQTNNCSATLAAGSSCQVQVSFVPSSAGAISDSLLLNYVEGGQANFVQAALSGTGTAPPPPVISINPAALNFGNQIQGTTSSAQIVTVSNSGQGSLEIFNISLTQDIPGIFNQTNDCTNVVIPPGGSCAISVTFNPTAADSYSGTIEVDNSNALPSQTIAITGAGIAPLASLTPASMSFTTTAGTTSAAQTATLTNAGVTHLSILNISIAEASSSDYQQTNNCGTLLAEGASCTISVTFTPANAGSYSATLTVSDSDPTSPQTVNLAGKATSTPDFVVASATPPQSIAPGDSAEFSLTVTAQNGASIPAVTLTATGLPLGATATFSQSTVTPGSTSATSTLTIKTASATGASGSSTWQSAIPALALIGWFFIPVKRRRRLSTLSVLLVASLGSLTFLGGCGAHFAGYSTVPSQDAPKTYLVTITASIGEVQQTTKVQLTVN